MHFVDKCILVNPTCKWCASTLSWPWPPATFLWSRSAGAGNIQLDTNSSWEISTLYTAFPLANTCSKHLRSWPLAFPVLVLPLRSPSLATDTALCQVTNWKCSCFKKTLFSSISCNLNESCPHHFFFLQDSTMGVILSIQTCSPNVLRIDHLDLVSAPILV